MGFLKKITRPISRVLDKVIPNEIKPALPFLAAAAPFMAPGLMSLGGNTMLSRALISGGLNLGSQLAQEGSEGDFSALSLAMASGIGALSAPGSAGGRTIGDSGASYSQVMGGDKLASAGTQSAGDILRTKAAGMDSGITKSGLEFLGKGSDKLIGLSEGLAADGIFSKAGAKALSIPFTQGTMDLAVAENRRFNKQQIIDDALGALDDTADAAARASAIRLAMQQYGFTEDEITETIASAGYRAGGRVGFQGGGMDAGQMYITEPGIMGNPAVMEKIENMREFMIANPDIEDITDYSEKYESKDPDFEGVKSVVKEVDKNEAEEETGIMETVKKGGLKFLEKVGENLRYQFDDFVYDEPATIGFSAGNYNPKILRDPKKRAIIRKQYDTLSDDKKAYIEMYLDSIAYPDKEEFKDYMFIKPGKISFPVTERQKEHNKKIMLKKFNENKNPLEKLFNVDYQKKANGGLMDLGGREMDMRGGGFIPIGKKERADDVPARLSKNEFVMTADAVRAAGGGSVNKGAKRMYDLMNNLEARV